MTDNPNGLAEALSKDVKVRAVLDAIDEVRPFLKDMEGLSQMLTAIVVVGDQSSGKSSTLERIAGIDLPRGQGICTRVPLEMQMRKGSKFSATLEYQQEKGGSKQSVEIKDASKISDAIQAATRDIVGNSKNVEDLPLVLRISSPIYQDLTLIDLPGIARAPLPGQRSDIEEQTLEMMRRYITGEAKVILCALPATNDFVTSAALKLALQLDPDGERTLGAVTKIDQARKGIAKKLEGTDASEITLHLGFAGVRCRTENETDAGITLEQVRQAEEELFRTHDELKHVDDSCKGVSALLQKLVAVQRGRLISHLPKVLHQVDDQLKVQKEIIDKLPDVLENADDAFAEARDCVRKICTEFQERAKNERLDSDVDLRVSIVLSREFEKFYQQIGEICRGLFKDQVWEHIESLNRDLKGAHLPNFLPPPVFDILFKEHVLDKLNEPALALLETVSGEVERILGVLTTSATKMYPNLNGIISSQVSDFLGETLEVTEDLVLECTSSQSECMTNTTMYIDALEEMKAIKSRAGTKSWMLPAGSEELKWFLEKAAGVTTPDKVTTMEIFCALGAQAKTVGLILAEQIPKFIRRNLVFKLHNNRALENYLVKALGRDQQTLFEMMVDERLAKKRDKSEQNIKNLKIARRKLRSAIGFGGK
ncbi:hypothetical protein BSKO_11855 [Bryopsis sp. KO-2023]|nr:hypothetical protein BSKO_11855 [Bryopsis sp. KO-2023]